MDARWTGPVALALVVSCSSGGDGGAASEERLRDQACTDVARAVCATRDKCVPFYINFYIDLPTCERQRKTECLAELAAPSSGATTAYAGACAQAYQAASAACDTLLYRDDPAACTPPKGRMSNGGACWFDSQCTSGHCKGTTGPCGRCVDQPGEGAPCDDGYCGDLVCAKGKCAKLGALDAACDEAHPCRYGLWCISGKCVAGGKRGDPCDAKGVAKAGCEITSPLFCGASGICQLKRLVKTGEQCGYVGSESRDCVAGAVCRAGKDGTRACVALANDGEACDETCVRKDAKGNCLQVQGPECRPLARCISGICAVPAILVCR